ncbi:GerAB/ArcD/ProY family transporter [Saliterribacillus persicus]|uniref:Spore germination protein (Amino acid permease) n=1 Tax=Saliterribacillus persicus TaxID=930114 RepID=A0A368XGA2_9BACI|nr:GerAB/ArcD/ProY family transporter [Saliterribacillus persicus]RCW66993.1 spore germination protein (amino acid permease) [Saliterribacillus persicus]
MPNHANSDITQQVSPFLIFFIIHASQVGEGVLSFERFIAEKAGYDSWISILLTGIIFSIAIFLICKLSIRNNGEDLIAIHQSLFGKYIGGFFSLFFIAYFFLITMTVIRSYIEIIQVWIFPDLSVFLFSLIIFILLLYYVLGGLRIVVGLLFFSIFTTTFLFSFKYVAFTNGYFSNLLPIMDHSFTEILQAVEPMTYSFLGPELILVYAPFIHQFQKGIKWAIIGNLFTMLVYFLSAFAIFLYFNEQQLLQLSWPTLHMWKVIDLPFIERFEYVGITLHFIAIISTAAIYYWACTQSLFRLTGLSFKKIATAILIISIGFSFFIHDFLVVEFIMQKISKVGFYIIVAYFPILFLWQSILLGVKKK